MWHQLRSLFYSSHPIAATDDAGADCSLGIGIGIGGNSEFRIVASADHPPLIAMQAPVEIMAATSSKGPPKFVANVYNGVSMNLRGWSLPLVIDLAGMEFATSLIANLDHDGTKRVGHVTGKEKTESELRLSGVISAATDAAREVIESSKLGFPFQCSVEAHPIKVVEVPAGESATVNGSRHDGPLFIASKTVLTGFAFCSLGADSSTSVSIAAGAAEQVEFQGGYSDEYIAAIIEQIEEFDSDCAEIMANFDEQIELRKEALLQAQQDGLFNDDFLPYREWSGCDD